MRTFFAKIGITIDTNHAAGDMSSNSPGWVARGEDYPGTVTDVDVEIPMSDGESLRGNVIRPANDDGRAVGGRLPVLVMITPYNKNIITSPVGTPAGGGSHIDYLVQRGYVVVVVDARGTGSSPGTWELFSLREQVDAGEIIAWAASTDRPWSSGRVGMFGASYMGMSQVFAAAHQPPGLRAIVPSVPAADLYRDMFATGGAFDVGFVPAWMTFVTSVGVLPPAYGLADPASAIQMLLDRIEGATTETAPLLLESILGGDKAYDGPYYQERSPIHIADRVQVPTLLIGGWRDLFQRGVVELHERMCANDVPVRMVYGPWDHAEICGGDVIADAGHGTLDELHLRWFDHHVRGEPDAALDADLPPVTWHELQSDEWHTTGTWLSSTQQTPITWRLSGTATPGEGATLVRDDQPEPGESVVPPVPVSGLLTRSTDQALAGLLSAIGLDGLLDDNAANDGTGIMFETPPMREPLRILGPIAARLHVSTPTGNGMLALTLSDVDPEGTVTRLTGGWLVLSHHATDKTRSLHLDETLIRPWHPHTEQAHSLLTPGEVTQVDVEVWPVGAAIPTGHRMRLSVQVFDVPHVLPSLPDITATLTPVTIHTTPQHPSTLTVPTLGRA